MLLSEHGIYLRERYLAEHAWTENVFLKRLKLGFARRMTELATASQTSSRRAATTTAGGSFATARPSEPRDDVLRGRRGRFAPDGHSPTGRRSSPGRAASTRSRTSRRCSARPPSSTGPAGGPVPAVRERQAGTERYLTAAIASIGRFISARTVTFEGFRPQSRLGVGDADLVVLSSISEGFPFTTLEAMMSGKPVVATAVGGVREQVPPSCGLTVGPRDPRRWRAAILKVLDDPDACAGARPGSTNLGGVDVQIERFRSTHSRSTAGCCTTWGGSPLRTGACGTGRAAFVVRRENGCGTARRRRGHRRTGASLTAELAARVPQPVDSLELAAVLESLGITDYQGSLARYGARNTFELGRARIRRIDGRPAAAPHPRLAPRAAGPGPGQIARASGRGSFGDSPRGLLALLPLLLLLGTIRVFANAGWDGGRDPRTGASA